MSEHAERGTDLSPLTFLWEHLTANFPVPSFDFTGRTVLVTGGNAGLGFQAVLHLARANASRIIIASRNRSKCETKAREVHSTVPSFRGTIDIEELDLGSFASVVAFARRIRADPRRLDVVLANAGLMTAAFKRTGDGHEEVVQVNALSTGLLAMLLLPKLEETGRMEVPKGASDIKPHLTIVSSEVHYWAKFAQHASPEPLLQSLNQPETYVDGNERYYVSKLLDIFIAREMAKLPAIASGAVVLNTVNPGLCKSGFRDDGGAVLAAIMNFFAWPTEFGARNYIHAIGANTAPAAFVSHCEERPVSTFTVSPEGRAAQAKFWGECLELWKGLAPELAS